MADWPTIHGTMDMKESVTPLLGISGRSQRFRFLACVYLNQPMSNALPSLLHFQMSDSGGASTLRSSKMVTRGTACQAPGMAKVMVQMTRVGASNIRDLQDSWVK